MKDLFETELHHILHDDLNRKLAIGAVAVGVWTRRPSAAVACYCLMLVGAETVNHVATATSRLGKVANAIDRYTYTTYSKIQAPMGNG